MSSSVKSNITGFEEIQNNHLLELLDNQDYVEILHFLRLQHHADIASFLTMLSYDKRREFVSILINDFDPLILLSLDTDLCLQIIEMLGPEKITQLITKLPDDEVISILEDLPEQKQNYILASLSVDKKTILKETLAYPKDSVGRLMEKNFIVVYAYWNVAHTTNYLKNNQKLFQEFYEIYVIDENQHPVGSIAASKILCSGYDMLVRDIMNEKVRPVEAVLDKEELSHVFNHYEMQSAPIIDKSGKMVGVVDVKDIVDIMQEEAEEDLLYSGGIKTNDIHANVTRSALNRLPWLMINLLIASFTSQVIHVFEPIIEQILLLATLMPIVASIGGNTGTQTITIIIRAIATKSISYANLHRIIWKELGTCLLTGSVLAAIGFTTVFLLYHDIAICGVFAAAIFLNIMAGGLFGTFIPIILNYLKADPAISSSIFLTGATDMIGFFTFLILASYILC